MPSYHSEEMLDHELEEAKAAIKRLAEFLGKLDHTNALRIDMPSVLSDRIAAWEHLLETNNQ
jgi:hypothetical protein